jgi:outer membrane protein
MRRARAVPAAEFAASAAALLLACAMAPAPARAQAQAPAQAPTRVPAQPSAAAPDTLALTLEEALTRARQASPALGRATALQEAAAATLRGARAERLPQLDLSAVYTRQSDVPELTVTLPGLGTQTLFPNIPENSRTRVGFWLPLFTGGRIAGQVDAAAGDWDAAGSDVGTAGADIALESATAYWTLVSAREAERVMSTAVDTYEAHARDARNRETLGLAARNEVLAVEVVRDRAELARLEASQRARVAQANLQRLLGVSGTTGLAAREPLDRLVPVAPSVDSLVVAALSSRSERTALAARAEAAQARVRATRGARWPQLLASGGYDYANPNRRILPQQAKWEDSWDVAVSLSLNVFDGGRISSSVARAAAQGEAVRFALRDLDERIRLDVTERALELASARQSVAVASRALASAQESRRVATDRYREGMMPSSELLDAETALLRAGLDYTEARARLQLAAAQLERAVGGGR